MLEIERKFLVKKDYRPSSRGERIVQGYLSESIDCTVRVRLYGSKGFLTIKGRTHGLSRTEWEYEIPVSDAEELIAIARQNKNSHLIEKTRYLEEYQGQTFEVDVFLGANAGLIVAEIELPTEATEVKLPPWAGEEVSHDKRYYNSNLSQNPYSNWAK